VVTILIPVRTEALGNLAPGQCLCSGLWGLCLLERGLKRALLCVMTDLDVTRGRIMLQ
jgi:hypothetical protein